ncbi:MAG: glycosyltransferase family 4 protein [Candidatus Eisenbacteria bacterium]|nr:glycosyltransferase family 4 protein [Candidatus Eisenbacteria bacterium]
MRILVLGDARQPHFARWAEAFRAGGAEVEGVTMQAPAAPPEFPLHVLDVSGPGFLRTRAALPAALAVATRFRPDALGALFVPDYGLLGSRLAARLSPRPRLWVAALGSDVLRNAWRTPLHLARARGVLSRADAVAVDAGVLARGVSRLGVAGEKTVRVDWVPDLGRFAFRAERPAGARRILSTRQLAPVYDVATLVRAALRLAQRRADFELVVAGDGPQRERLERLAAPIAARVRFVGRQDPEGVARLLGEAGVYVSTARSDSTSVSLLEAMACGCMPVVTSIEGNREWITEGSSGLLFPSGDDEELARQISRALDDDSLRDRVAAFNRRRLEALPTFAQAVKGLMSR